MVDSRPLSVRRKLSLALLFNLYCLYLDKISGQNTQSSEVIVTQHAAVATDDERCSKIGKDILRGLICSTMTSCFKLSYPGNAIDAAVAATLCLGVVSPASSGIGGGAFMLLRLANGTTQAFDMRETAPRRASKDMYHGNATLKAKGPLSIAVPGELAGLYEVWKQHGSLPWEMLVLRAINLADEGFEISPYLYSEMVLEESDILADKGLSDIFTINGSLLQPGDICHNKKLAETLKTISKYGVEAFYNGLIGKKLIRDIEELGGIMDMLDLMRYEVEIKEPISADILGMTILGMPPPSAGGAGIVLMLNILAQYGSLRDIDIASLLGIHRMIEAMKHVFAVRMNIGDPNFVNVSEVVSDMLSLEFAKELKNSNSDKETFDPDHYGGKWNEVRDYLKNEYGTSHLSILDEYGNAVALTASVNYHFGSKILSSSTGILLNNQMDDFSMPHYDKYDQLKANNNYIQGGKRPLSSMSPTILLKNGNLKAVLGGSGGCLIIPGVSQVILNLFAMNLNLTESIMTPRVYHQLIPNVVNYENFTSVTGDTFEVHANILKDLKKKGHALHSHDSGAICQVITLNQFETDKKGEKDYKVITAVSDSRKGGIPAGY